MKTRINPGESLFQIVVVDYSQRGNGHRKTYVPPSTNVEARKKGKKLEQTDYAKIDGDYVLHRTLFRWAKNGKRAMRKVGRRFGSIISCRKVDSHYRHLNMIEYLNLDQKKIEVDMTVEEFTMNRDGEVSRSIEIEGREIDIE